MPRAQYLLGANQVNVGSGEVIPIGWNKIPQRSIALFLSGDPTSLRGNGEDRRGGLLARVRQRHENQQEREHRLGPEIVIVYPVPEILILDRHERGVRSRGPAVYGDGGRRRVRGNGGSREGSPVSHVL